MLETLSASATPPPILSNPNAELIKIYDVRPYCAYCEDLEFMWRWTIYQDNKLVQEGCSLSLDSSKHAVNHVLAFFNTSNRNYSAEQEF